MQLYQIFENPKPLFFLSASPLHSRLPRYRVPVAYLDTVQLFDCLFANTCEGMVLCL
jgi:hypothetical protein